MFKKIVFFLPFFWLTAYSAPVTNPYCKKEAAPKVVHRIDNWEIIANNRATILVAPAFQGKHLSFSISVKPMQTKNKIKIDEKTGIIKIKAVKKDSFDVTVKAKNRCDSAEATFNVHVVEES